MTSPDLRKYVESLDAGVTRQQFESSWTQGGVKVHPTEAQKRLLDQFSRDGLFGRADRVTMLRREKETRRAFLGRARASKRERKARFVWGFTKRGTPFKRSKKTGRFQRLNRRDVGILRSIKADFRVKKRSPSGAKKRPERG